MKLSIEILDFLGSIGAGMPAIVLYANYPKPVSVEVITVCVIGLSGIAYLVLRTLSIRDRLEILNGRIQANEYPGI